MNLISATVTFQSNYNGWSIDCLTDDNGLDILPEDDVVIEAKCDFISDELPSITSHLFNDDGYLIGELEEEDEDRILETFQKHFPTIESIIVNIDELSS